MNDTKIFEEEQAAYSFSKGSESYALKHWESIHL